MAQAITAGHVLDVLQKYTAVTLRLQISGVTLAPGLPAAAADAAEPPSSKVMAAESELIAAAANSRRVVDQKAEFIVKVRS